MRTPLAVALAAPLLILSACREESISHTRVPKEAPVAAITKDSSAAMPGVLPPPAARPRGLAWRLPPGWKEVAGNGIRLATFVPPGGLKTEATVVALPGDSGGELANVNRWRGQISLPATDEAGMVAARVEMATQAGPARVYDFTSGGQTRTRLIAAAINIDGTTWFFKLMGDADATESARAGFLTIIKGLKRDAAK